MAKEQVKEKGISPAIIIIPLALGLGAAAVVGLAAMAKGAVTPPPAGKATLYGKVTDYSTGVPLAGATLTLDGAQASTDSGGNYTFSDVEPGSYTLTLTKSGYISISESITLPEGMTQLDVPMVPVAAPAESEFYMPPNVTFEMEYTWGEFPYSHYRFEVTITNRGGGVGTYSYTYEVLYNSTVIADKATVSITLGPGESFTWLRYYDIRWDIVANFKLSLSGSWPTNNYATTGWLTR